MLAIDKHKKEFTMNKTVKTILIIAGVLVLVCACATTALFVSGVWTAGKIVQWADTSTTEDPQEVAKIASEIADFELPEGFDSPYGMHLAEFTSVGYFSQGRHTHIYLTQFPKDVHMDIEEMMRMTQEGAGDPQAPLYGISMAVIEDRPVTICGQESTLSIQEGKSSDGDTFRTATVTFEGKGGNQAVLAVSGPSDEWDDELIEELIASFQ
jgi:hypothetical protein